MSQETPETITRLHRLVFKVIGDKTEINNRDYDVTKGTKLTYKVCSRFGDLKDTVKKTDVNKLQETVLKDMPNAFVRTAFATEDNPDELIREFFGLAVKHFSKIEEDGLQAIVSMENFMEKHEPDKLNLFRLDNAVRTIVNDDFNTEGLIRLTKAMNEEDFGMYEYKSIILRNLVQIGKTEDADDLSVVDSDIEELEQDMEELTKYLADLKALREKIANGETK